MDTPTQPNLTHYTNLSQPLVILIRGLPGGGKSYLAAQLQKIFGADATVMLDPDAIDFDSQAYKDHVTAATAEGVDEKLFPYRFLRGLAYDGIAAHKIVIWNQGFTNLEIFAKMLGRFQEHADAHNIPVAILIVEVNIDSAVAKGRIAERVAVGGHNVPDEAFERFVQDYTTAAGEGYDVVSVDGQGDVMVSAALVKSHADKLLSN